MQTAAQIIKPNKQFVVRTPIYSKGFYNKIFGVQTADEYAVKMLLQDELIREAIYISSPSLFNEIDKVLSNQITQPKKLKKFWNGVYKYLLRMSTRTTPFGLFAGLAIGSWGTESAVIPSSFDQFKRHTRIDMHIVVAISQYIAKINGIKEQLLYFPNSSLYTIAGQFRFTEYKYQKGKRTHHTIAIDENEYIHAILGKAKNGANINTLSEEIVEDEIPFEDAKYFVEELINSQLLIPELEPSLTGDEFENQIVRKLERLIPDKEGVIKKVLNIFYEIQKLLTLSDKSITQLNIPVYNKIVAQLEKLELEFDKKNLIQTNLSLDFDKKTLDKSLLKDIYSGLDVLNRLNPKNPKNSVEKFAKAFRARYESQEVPLTEAIDMELGLGYPVDHIGVESNPLIDDIELPPLPGSIPEFQWTPTFAFLQKKYEETVVFNQKDEIVITDQELKDFPINWEDFSFSFNTIVKLLGKNKEGKEVIYMDFAGGTSGTYMMTRFGHSNPEVKELVQEICDLENDIYSNFILAEVVHLPKDRTGNIISRPAFRDYEIPYLTSSAAKGEFQIPVTDIMISVQGNNVFLRSEKHNKYILPKLSTAENYVRPDSLPLYMFLCDMQYNNRRGGVQFTWGPNMEQHKFLPRVKYKNIILSLAQWKIKTEDIIHLYKITEDEKLIDAVTIWRKNQKMPEMVHLKRKDSSLLISLENKESIMVWLSEVKTQNEFKFEEYLFEDNDHVVSNATGSYHNEFIIPFSNNQKVKHS